MRAWCVCVVFRLWYVTTGGTRVCECGHPGDEHLDDRTTCLGDVEVYAE